MSYKALGRLWSGEFRVESSSINPPAAGFRRDCGHAAACRLRYGQPVRREPALVLAHAGARQEAQRDVADLLRHLHGEVLAFRLRVAQLQRRAHPVERLQRHPAEVTVADPHHEDDDRPRDRTVTLTVEHMDALRIDQPDVLRAAARTRLPG